MAVGAAALLGGAGLLAGCAPKNPKTAYTGSADGGYPWETEVDVIVVGSGTGMMAAIKAAEAGAKVLLLEKRERLGGDVGINGGIIYATETSVMKDAGGVIDPRTGKEDTIESMVDDWMRSANTDIDRDWAMAVAQQGPALIDWFRERGLNFGLYQSGPDPVTRGHQATKNTDGTSQPTPGAGGMFIEIMAAECDKLGVDTRKNTRVTKIITDDFDNIIGVKAKSDGKDVYFGAPAVVLATGGAGEANDLIMQYNPEALGWTNDGSPGQSGDGYYLTEPLGAGRCGQRNWFSHDYPNPGLALSYGNTTFMEISAVFNYEFAQKGPRAYIYVDTDAKRFTDDTKGYVNGVAIDVAQSASGYAWFVFDNTLWNETMFAEYFSGKGIDELVEEETIYRADSIEALAEQIDIDGAALAQTVEKWNADAKAGEDTEFGRIAQSLAPIEQGPFFAYKLVPCSDSLTLGPSISLDIDSSYHVLDREGDPIPGLFACGLGLTWFRQIGYGYPGSGTACGYMAGTGFCGENAAKFAASRK